VADCVEWTWERIPDLDRLLWWHGCLCPHGQGRGVHLLIDPALPSNRREVQCSLVRERVHALRCEDDHPERVTDG